MLPDKHHGGPIAATDLKVQIKQYILSLNGYFVNAKCPQPSSNHYTLQKSQITNLYQDLIKNLNPLVMMMYHYFFHPEECLYPVWWLT